MQQGCPLIEHFLDFHKVLDPTDVATDAGDVGVQLLLVDLPQTEALQCFPDHGVGVLAGPHQRHLQNSGIPRGIHCC
eukprot:CAMPEP_0177657176 /NCGR_PEP_ID=MMETSP0447-20121125/16028_1 /TAXON_ID=0 /ORGANISM="Stygamoeba regulata, Strain BSH-02190019" /LENGTH=76 /DNA_ID=CAMNT_0019161479 /DNA_START=203 /DNA_END=430 /DNA_ORIENTATION=-